MAAVLWLMSSFFTSSSQMDQQITRLLYEEGQDARGVRGRSWVGKAVSANKIKTITFQTFPAGLAKQARHHVPVLREDRPPFVFICALLIVVDASDGRAVGGEEG